jgi:NLR family CARD domain-containing protein 3
MRTSFAKKVNRHRVWSLWKVIVAVPETEPVDCTPIKMAWGAKRGISDIVSKLQANDAALVSLVLLSTRTFEQREACELAQALAENTSLRELFASGHDIGIEGAAAIGAALKRNSTLQVLCIGGSEMGDHGIAALIADGLLHNGGLQRLDLDYKSLTDAAHLSTLLHQHTTLRDLRLGRNLLGHDGIIGLCKGLQHSSSLTSLDLSANSITAQAAAALASALPASLQHIELSENEMSSDVGAVFFNSIAAVQAGSLTSLTLRDCKLDAIAGKSLAAAMASTGLAALTRLDLTNNSLARTAASCCSANLQWLSLSNNQLDAETVVELAQTATTSNTLKFLDVSNNNIGTAGFEALLLLTCLHELRVFNNKLGNAGAAVMQTILQNAETCCISLQTLDIGANSINGIGTAMILTAVQQCNTLTVLELGGNTIDDTAEAAIKHSQQTHPQLDVCFKANGQSL